MTLHKYIHAVAVPTLFLLANSSGSLRADQATDDWLRASGKDLQLRLKGEVFNSDGQPATDVKITGSMNAWGSNQPFEPTVDGHRFEVWIPVNQARWYSMWLKAASTNRDRVAYKKLNAFEFRQAAIDGIKLTLRSPTRHVEVKVVDEGQPVSGALVKAELGFGIELRSRADADGVVRLGLLPRQKLSRLTAWTDDFRIGGFSFNRKATRDPDADEHVVELSRCRDQKLRFVDQDGSPVPGIDFVLQMATGPPNYNFIGTNEHSRMTTDAAGEVMYRWFPDWDEHYFYADLNTDKWVTDGDGETVDGAAVFKLKRRKHRRHVHGRVVSTSTGVGGFYVSLRSPQGERENSSDVILAFTDSGGRFSVDVLPDATYCAYALDSRWVGEIVDLIPYQSAFDQVTPPELSVSAGQEVEVIVTSGPQKKPYPNLTISFRRQHRYTWREDGRTRNGIGGPQWWATTDESGRATTRTLPGKLKAAVYTPLWRIEETVDVSSGEVAKIKLHREVEEKRAVTGRLVLAEGLESNLENAEIQIGTVDGNYDDQQTLKSGKDGSFSFETLAAEIGVFGYTQDGQAAGSIVVKDLDSPIELHLRPTMDYHGQLLGEGDQPLVGHGVRATVRVEGEEDHDAKFPKSFEAKRIDAETDEQGNFQLRGVPGEMKVFIQADAIDDSRRGVYLGEIYLEPNESRPRTVSRLAKTSRGASEIPLAERYEKTLRDCALLGFHLMVITSSNTEIVTKFVDQYFIDYQTNKEVAAFMQIVVSRSRESLESADAAFLKERNWQLPREGRVFVCAIDAKGNELGRLEIDVTDTGANEEAADFIHQHAPSPVDAEKKWHEAFAEANRSNRRVWARISQRYCGPCFRMARWLGDQHELLEKDYVMLKIDNVGDQNGTRVAKRLTRGKNHGVPFHAIFDQDEVMLIDSEGPLGNIGHPSGFEGKKQLRKILLKTRRNLTDAEIDQLVESLGD